MLDKIKKALETVTEAHHFSQSDIKKLFCGLAHIIRKTKCTKN